MNKAQQIRIDAMVALNTKWLEIYKCGEIFGNRRSVADDIRELRTLGRTVRWQGSIDIWANEVEESETQAHCEWAFLQYCVYAGYAS